VTIGSPDSSTAKEAKKALGARMREIRKDAGLNARALALATDQHYTRVSKIENGKQMPTDKDIREWCVACRAEDQVPDLIATARAVASAYLEFLRQARAGMRRVVGPHTMERYTDTTTFRIYEHNVIPGLFQTPTYCESMVSFWIKFLGTPNDLKATVDDRMHKQEIIGWRGKKFHVVLEEQALRTWFGDADVQSGQLGRLLELLNQQDVTLGIIPLMRQRTGVPSAPFWIFDEQLVALETPTASIEVARPEEIGLYLRMFGHLQAAAVYGAEARALIVKALDEMA
jgi:transcriptional regulator with XRE-family HTH domain